MKTAVSIPDKVFESAEKLAGQLGKSRSQLYTQALKSYVERRSSDDVTKKLDEVYSKEKTSLDPTLQKLQHQSLSKDTW